MLPVLLLAAPGAAHSQDAPEERADRPLLLVSGRYEAPLRTTAGVGVLFQRGTLGRDGDLGGQLRAHRGVLVEAAAGMGGVRVAAGFARRLKEPDGPVFFGEDLLVSVVRTGDAPRGASAASTYVGVEAGLTLVAVRVSAGVAVRADGSDAPQRTTFIWSAGVHTGW